MPFRSASSLRVRRRAAGHRVVMDGRLGSVACKSCPRRLRMPCARHEELHQRAQDKWNWAIHVVIPFDWEMTGEVEVEAARPPCRPLGRQVVDPTAQGIASSLLLVLSKRLVSAGRRSLRVPSSRVQVSDTWTRPKGSAGPLVERARRIAGHVSASDTSTCPDGTCLGGLSSGRRARSPRARRTGRLGRRARRASRARGRGRPRRPPRGRRRARCADGARSRPRSCR